jgi:hypothetical protein
MDREEAIRSVVDGSAPNWIDTAGHARGCMALRWVGADRDSQPRTRVVKHAAVAAG